MPLVCCMARSETGNWSPTSHTSHDVAIKWIDLAALAQNKYLKSLVLWQHAPMHMHAVDVFDLAEHISFDDQMSSCGCSFVAASSTGHVEYRDYSSSGVQ